MTYRILIDTRAAKQLEKLPNSAVERIDAVIAGLAAAPRPRGAKMLHGELKPG